MRSSIHSQKGHSPNTGPKRPNLKMHSRTLAHQPQTINQFQGACAAVTVVNRKKMRRFMSRRVARAGAHREARRCLCYRCRQVREQPVDNSVRAVDPLLQRRVNDFTFDVDAPFSLSIFVLMPQYFDVRESVTWSLVSLSCSCRCGCDDLSTVQCVGSAKPWLGLLACGASHAERCAVTCHVAHFCFQPELLFSPG